MTFDNEEFVDLIQQEQNMNSKSSNKAKFMLSKKSEIDGISFRCRIHTKRNSNKPRQSKRD
jgi:hypothetical protein